jgi:probable rRNA maturation factor
VNSLATDQARVTLQLAANVPGVPDAESFRRWVNCAFSCAGRPLPDNSCVAIKVVDETESAALNSNYRHIVKPTNVLAFPAAEDHYPLDDIAEVELGDLAICAAVVLTEAKEQSKSVESHFAHMTVHGSLHLLGYDHMTEQDASEMESLEKQVMQKLGFPDPYRDDHQDLKRA